VEKKEQQSLIFFVAQDASDEIRLSVKQLVERLAGKRSWAVSPPSFVDTEDDVRPHDEDIPDATIGGCLKVYSVSSSELARDLDLAILHDVEEVVAEVQALSEGESISFEFELDGKFVGAIDDGQIDNGLSEGLLGEWRRHLEC